LRIVIHVDSHVACREDVEELSRFGSFVHVEVVVNERWNDTSALRLAAEAGLTVTNVLEVADDTPGLLSITMACTTSNLLNLNSMLGSESFVWDWYPASWA
jgi:hypothetical protein